MKVEFIEFTEHIHNPLILRINSRVREWCKLPYSNNKSGCQCYGKYNTCPPDAPMFHVTFDLNRSFIIAFVEFDLKEFSEKLRERNPNLTEKQSRCLLYWQKGVIKTLKKGCEKFIRNLNTPIHRYNLIYTLRPEGMGLNVFNLMYKAGRPLDRVIKDKVVKVAIIGHKRCFSKYENPW